MQIKKASAGVQRWLSERNEREPSWNIFTGGKTGCASSTHAIPMV